MRKYDTTFTLKCDQEFKDKLEECAKHFKMSKGWVLRGLVNTLNEEIK